MTKQLVDTQTFLRNLVETMGERVRDERGMSGVGWLIIVVGVIVAVAAAVAIYSAAVTGKAGEIQL